VLTLGFLVLTALSFSAVADQFIKPFLSGTTTWKCLAQGCVSAHYQRLRERRHPRAACACNQRCCQTVLHPARLSAVASLSLYLVLAIDVFLLGLSWVAAYLLKRGPAPHLDNSHKNGYYLIH
jgi:hypothetical protein